MVNRFTASVLVTFAFLASLASLAYAQSVAVSFGGNGAKPISALLATPVSVKGAPGLAAALLCNNPNASTEYVQFYDTAATVTPGTTANKFFVPLPASTTTLVTLGVDMFTAIQVAATTGPTNGVAPGSGLPCTVLFK